MEFTPATLDDVAKSNKVLFELHASWCGHCARFAPVYKQVAKTLESSGIVVGRADGSVYRILSQRFQVSGFPSFYYIESGRVYEFVGSRSADTLVDFANSGGASNGKKITGITAPFSPYWKVTSHILRAWDAAVLYVESKSDNPGLVAVAVVLTVLAGLGVFAFIIHFVTKPTVRPKES